MNVIFFLSVTNKQGARLARIVELFFSKRRIDKCGNRETPGKKLHQRYTYTDVVLLFPASKEKLSRLLAMRNLLWI
jgi:hypothetical protein